MEQKARFLAAAAAEETWISFAHDDVMFAARVKDDRGRLVVTDQISVRESLQG